MAMFTKHAGSTKVTISNETSSVDVYEDEIHGFIKQQKQNQDRLLLIEKFVRDLGFTHGNDDYHPLVSRIAVMVSAQHQ